MIASCFCVKNRIPTQNNDPSSHQQIQHKATTSTELQHDDDHSSQGEYTDSSTTEDDHKERNTQLIMPEKGCKRLTEGTMSQNLKCMEYAVRGQVVIAADRIREELKDKKNKKKYPFTSIVYTNIGNPQSVGQEPLTYPRQVLALVDLPDDLGIDHPNVTSMFPNDVIERAKIVKEALDGNGTGSYTHSQGPKAFRQEICKFIEERDGLVKYEGRKWCHEDRIFMTNGASSAIQMMLTCLISGSNCGVMTPIPQYPIYSALIHLLGGQKVDYYLDEKNGWNLNVQELERSLRKARDEGIVVNSFVLINPGNPTGQVLSKESIQGIVKFCAKHKLVLLADEVYQENVYDDNSEFYSCKKASIECGLCLPEGSDEEDEEEKDYIELVSFHSTSKGLFGECGRRGGYMELQGIDPIVQGHLYKLASSGLCSNTPGQIMTSLMVNGPKEGDESYVAHEAEKKAIYDGLKKRAKIASDGFNKIPGFSCQNSAGAMYCFPSVKLPKKAVQDAQRKELAPDTMYAVSLLESTGICVVPASGFGQEEGRFGFRTTFLPSEEQMVIVVDAVRKHHEEFCARYNGFFNWNS